jgi:hypothetical protein
MGTKICVSCSQEKSINDFAFSKGKPREKCKECLKKYMSEHYKSHKKSYIDNIKQRKNDLYKWIKEYKSKLKCEQCGENHPAVLDFHHVDPKQKDFSIGNALHTLMGKKRILREINKCSVLCSNCHRKLHWNEKNN